MPVRFFSEDVSFSLKNKRVLKSWINDVVNKNNYEVDNINIVFCSDQYLSGFNKTYLKHNTLTDIITFTYNNTETAAILGDIFISVERVKDNAKKYSISFSDELYRVIIHGILHLCGYEDKTKSEKNNMRAKENDSLQMLKKRLQK